MPRQLALFGMLACLVLPMAAQETQPIVLTVLSAEMDTIADGLTMQLRIDSKLTDLIYRTELRVPDALLKDRKIENLRQVDGEPVIGSPWFRDYRNDVVMVRVPPATRSDLFYRSKDLQGSVTLTFVAAGMPREVSTAAVLFTVKPRGPMLGVILGAILGVIAVVVLRLAIQFGKVKKISRADKKNAGASIVVGVVVVTILVFVVRENPGQFDLPLKVDVKDWVGGFFLGLFFEPLSKWLAEKIPGIGEPEQKKV